ncbi:MAG: DUF1343 domain-containing protein [Bacteroidetes bacterium]|nr:DUF1343 domain-containing protein [Bacteroidota bacterium]MBU1486361.1 DUF1343 domain-containing protein [Bacteroidota bacterium]MBU2046757.1 DUF1343 domain-containing protein [Bacteroidota bacterium]MBU2268313.1 DUF1343 domain-containing protein [Bacteroidota bacterium]MBU2377419.1 DUF1343 domain-containing protein [Bacteroidota bacterium]
MRFQKFKLLSFCVPIVLILGNTCNASNSTSTSQIKTEEVKNNILTGADQTEKYIPLLKGKRIGLVINQTAEINGTPLVDTLKSIGIDIKAIFGPEHGFRGTADAGEKVGNYIDSKTGFPVISLYGAKQAPDKEDLKNIDLMVFDIQDVGARFYTFTITMARVMQACADNHVPLLILDRPNPNGNLVDGPILDPKFKSGVGMHPIPISHGLTVGEFAQMINGEGWLKDGVKCDLQIIKVANYSHDMEYILPEKPSPNLPNNLSIYLYPSICLFEGTAISQGRGTLFPFQVLGHPLLKGKYAFTFTPVSIDGMSKNPPLENQLCYGIDFRKQNQENIRKQQQLNLKILIELYAAFPDKEHFFNSFFNKLAGNDILMQQIKDGRSEKEIRASWEPGLSNYKVQRKKYLLYN